MYRINDLVKFDKKLYHSGDLANLWQISNKNTLYTTIKRYVKRGILVPIYKGLYSTVLLNQINPLELGKAIAHSYTYLSTESVLVQNGIIFQSINVYTFIAAKPKKVTVGEMGYVYRKMRPEYLFNSAGIIENDGLLTATTERAVADLLYFNPKYFFDGYDRIDWSRVDQIKKEVGYQ